MRQVRQAAAGEVPATVAAAEGRHEPPRCQVTFERHRSGVFEAHFGGGLFGGRFHIQGEWWPGGLADGIVLICGVRFDKDTAADAPD
jgi:hypothetical protein